MRLPRYFQQNFLNVRDVSSMRLQMIRIRTSFQDFQSFLQMFLKHLESAIQSTPITYQTLSVTNLNTYCNCYVNKTLVSISSYFLFLPKKISFSTILCYVINVSLCVFLSSLRVCLMKSRSPCIFAYCYLY